MYREATDEPERNQQMSLRFKSLSSSSAGNCLVLWSDKTRIIVDCGLPSIRRTCQLFNQNLGNPVHVDSVIVSHMHGDHINQQSLRVIEQYGLNLTVHEGSLDHLRGKHFRGYSFKSISLKTYSSESFTVGEFIIQPFEVPHNPNCPNFGFSIRFRDGGQWKTAVIVTDFRDGRDALDYFIDADFIFVESNHDPGLLAKYFNPNSMFHMNNFKTANLVHTAFMQSRRKPKTVMLGHLSSQRNTEQHALEEMRRVYRRNETDMTFELLAAPLYDGSRVIDI
jgi:phosphoribosyl 1,2-cyclic phosphodiesterase